MTTPPAPTRFRLEKTVTADDPMVAVDFLAAHTPLSKARLKDAMIKGAVWLKRDRYAQRRLRRAKTLLKPGDRIGLYYDEQVLNQPAPAARCLDDLRGYSVWFKPPGLLAQGTEYGDHASLLRQAEGEGRQVFLVHRLDREAGGLMLLAHDSRTAGQLGKLFQDNRIEKTYRVQVVGDVRAQWGERGEIDAPLDDKPALTRFEVIGFEDGRSVLKVNILTGRLHQIRRHLAGVGHPVVGDPKYGRGNKDMGGLRLFAVALSFDCPVSRKRVDYRLEDAALPF